MALRELEDGIRQLQLRNAELAAAIARIEPIGLIQAWAGPTLPSGWLWCQGQAISRTTYAQLFALVGTAYGTGNGSSTFNVPNAKGRVLVGQDAAQPDFAARGQTGGEAAVALTTFHIPSSSGNRLIDATAFETASSNAPVVAASGSRHKYRLRDVPDAHNNLQPYLTVNYIIKAL